MGRLSPLRFGKRFEEGFIAGFRAGKNISLQRVESLIHAEIRRLNRIEPGKQATKVKIVELGYVLEKIKELRP